MIAAFIVGIPCALMALTILGQDYARAYPNSDDLWSMPRTGSRGAARVLSTR